tara:strand:- start:105 stop:1151 length:1047 start_codon:yes stop_codon:yes gene_type:complete
MQNDVELLDLMLKDQLKQKGLYHPGPYWKGYSSRIAKAIRSEGLQNFRTNSRIGKGYADTVVMNPFDLSSLDSWKSKIHKSIIQLPFFSRRFIDPFVQLNERHFRQTQRYKSLYYTNIYGDWFSQFSKQHSLPDTLVGNPQNRISINNYEMGESYLASFIRVYNYSKVVDFNKVKSIIEIGGGFGAFAHTLLHLYPNIKKYIYLDIPPILYVGTQYLKHFYKDEVIDYRRTRKLKNINFSSNDQREIIAICPWEIEKIDANIDLFWNSASFQEMTHDMVLNYSHHINRMLIDSDSKLCLYVYKSGKPENTLMPKKLLEIVENNTRIVFDEFEPELEIANAHYFLGRKK